MLFRTGEQESFAGVVDYGHQQNLVNRRIVPPIVDRGRSAKTSRNEEATDGIRRHGKINSAASDGSGS